MGQDPKTMWIASQNASKIFWDSFDIAYDYFIRTTDSTHLQSAQYVFLKMYEKGDIYKGEYEGNYCISCESFLQNHN